MAFNTKIAATIILLLFCLTAYAAQVYQFANEHQRKTFYSVVGQTRCLVCQNETLLDSQAPLAQDLRQDIYKSVKAGQNQQQILNYLTERYGQFILFKPKMELQNYLLWLGPFILLFIVVVLLFLKRRQKSIVISAEQQQQAKKILQGDDL